MWVRVSINNASQLDDPVGFVDCCGLPGQFAFLTSTVHSSLRAAIPHAGPSCLWEALDLELKLANKGVGVSGASLFRLLLSYCTSSLHSESDSKTK